MRHQPPVLLDELAQLRIALGPSLGERDALVHQPVGVRHRRAIRVDIRVDLVVVPVRRRNDILLLLARVLLPCPVHGTHTPLAHHAVGCT
ncbi:hypothetical protein GCM10009557_19180 [Virgisporangium ochraceum]|uniref:Uncharacterized protein n=1 Tax=Virgisporangium ochraceum TaxID=65505 RepID=A0A8J3ZXB8_9ACTN|nr:hypothetical protein Voc01_041320 [Virgisporangium ochraceum]